MNFLKGLSLLVLGLGDSGLAMARWAQRCGAARIVVADTREAPPQAAKLAADVPGAELRCGPFEPTLLDGIQLILKSPGLAPGDAHIAPLLARAAEQGVMVRGELALFTAALADLHAERGYAPRVAAITGTNGKTTTASLTALLLERAGRRVALAGNIGPTMLDTLGAALDLEPPPAAPEEEAVPATGAVASQTPMSDEAGLPADAPAAAPVAAAMPADAAPTMATTTLEAFTAEPVPDDGAGLSDTTVAADAAEAADEPPDEPPEESSADDLRDLAALDGVESAEGEEAVVVDDTPMGDGADAEATTESATVEEGTAGDTVHDDALDLGGGPPPHLIPPPPPPPVFEHLPEAWVLELSSFQLDGETRFEPTVATVLNLSQDHLDWHGSMADYAGAKARIFGPAETSRTVLVINHDDPQVEALVPQPPAPVKGKARAAARPNPRKVVRFGMEPPAHPGDFGLVHEGGMAWLVRAMESDETQLRRPRRKAGATAEEPEELHLQRLMPADALRIRGRHNAANALAALALATTCGAPLAPMLHGLREYGGEPHRVEFIGMVAGLEAYDDSKGTNVGATVAALNGLGAEKAPAKLLLILGGDGKGQDFTPLAEPLIRHARAVALIGRDAATLEGVLAPALQAAGVPVALQRHDTLEAATRWAIERGHAGDALLLSPACASLDMFRNYAHRAEVFCATVQQVAVDRGEVMS